MQLDLTLWSPLIVVLAGLAVQGISKLNIPREYLPYFAPALGALIQAVEGLITGGKVDPAVGAGLGALAVFLHQLLKQWQKRKASKLGSAAQRGSGL